MADVLARFADLPVVDMTDLKGSYDFTMEFSPEDFRAIMIRTAIAQGTVLSPEVMKLADASSSDTLFNAVERLGLKLEHRKAPVDVLIVDQALKMPGSEPRAHPAVIIGKIELGRPGQEIVGAETQHRSFAEHVISDSIDREANICRLFETGPALVGCVR